LKGRTEYLGEFHVVNIVCDLAFRVDLLDHFVGRLRQSGCDGRIGIIFEPGFVVVVIDDPDEVVVDIVFKPLFLSLGIDLFYLAFEAVLTGFTRLYSSIFQHHQKQTAILHAWVGFF
jgi:hypothetical protein